MEKRGGYNKLKLSRKNITSLSQSLNKKKTKQNNYVEFSDCSVSTQGTSKQNRFTSFVHYCSNMH